jgi:hypothetical protein
MPSRVELQKDEMPLHFEGVVVYPAIRFVGWPVGAVGIGVGTWLVATAEAFRAEILGVLLAGCCGLLLVLLIRCRRFETVLGTRMLMVGAGPFKKRVPVGYIDDLETRAATSWRRFYSDREVVLSLRVGDRPIVIPTDRPEDLVSAIQASQGA